MPAVSNSSPLILFAAIGRLELLRDVYGEILVPPAVWRETVSRGAGRPGSAELHQADWIRLLAPTARNVARITPADLGEGETEAIALAMSTRPTATVILDDLPARRAALRSGLEVAGTGGVVVLAKHEGLIASVGSVLLELRDAGLYLSESVVETLLSLAEEP